MGESVRRFVAGLEVRRGAVDTPRWEQRVVLHEAAGLVVGNKTLDTLVFEAGAQPLKQVSPAYPLAMKGRDVGPVVCAVELSIDDGGRPTQARPAGTVDETCTEPFMAAAGQSLLRWRFLPAIDDGEATASDFVLKVRFFGG
jgi:hypothetical protein